MKSLFREGVGLVSAITIDNFTYERVARAMHGSAMGQSHCHTRFEIYYLLSGECRYFIGNRILQVKKNDIILIPRGVMHKTVYVSDMCERILLHFNGDYINPVIVPKFYRFFPNYIYTPSDEILPHIHQTFLDIEKECTKQDEFSQELLKGSVTVLLTEIARSAHSGKEEKFEKTNMIIEDAVYYMTVNFAENLTLESMARRAMVSESHFSRLFKNTTSLGFKEFLNMLRIREAQRLLLNTNESVCEIAFSCGFNDSNYFSTLFKSVHGVSPLGFRRVNRQL